MRKMRDVLTCVDLPQLEEAGWKIWEAFDMLVMGVRDRNQLVSHDLDAQSAALVDHLLDLVTRPPEEIERELKYGRKSSPGCSPAGGAAKPGQAWPAPVISEQAAQVLGVLGLLASTGSGDEALDAQHLEEAVLDVAQVRIYVVPLLEFLLAVDPLGAAFDLLQAGERDPFAIFSQCGLPPTSDEAGIVSKLIDAVSAADALGAGGRAQKRRELAGMTSEGRRQFGQIWLAMFDLALQSYDRSSASVRSRRMSAARLKSGLRWLSNVAKTLHKKGRQVVLPATPFT